MDDLYLQIESSVIKMLIYSHEKELAMDPWIMNMGVPWMNFYDFVAINNWTLGCTT